MKNPVNVLPMVYGKSFGWYGMSYSRWYVMRSGVGMLVRQIRVAMKRVVEL